MTAVCRRCAECEYSDHHWIENSDFGDTDLEATHVCKHCEARGEMCGDCDGEGGFAPDDGPLRHCETCGGEGVVLIDDDVSAAVDTILREWESWEAEAGQAAQTDQEPRSGELVMRSKLLAVLLPLRRQKVEG